MTLTLIRDHCFQDRVEGRLLIDGAQQCVTLEPPRRAENPTIAHPAIPAGTYPVVIAYSVKFQRMLPHITHVPGRTAIEIHAGNYATDTIGCVLVGTEREGNMILHSRVALEALMVALARILSVGQHVEITVQDPLIGEQVA